MYERLSEALFIVAYGLICALIFFWMGIGAGLQACVGAGDAGYGHKSMKPGTRVYCVIK